MTRAVCEFDRFGTMSPSGWYSLSANLRNVRLELVAPRLPVHRYCGGVAVPDTHFVPHQIYKTYAFDRPSCPCPSLLNIPKPLSSRRATVMSSPTASTASLISKDKKPSPPQKDYAAAFADLQSSYGASGHAPVLPVSSAKSSKKSKTDDAAATQPPSNSEPTPNDSKKGTAEGGLQPPTPAKKDYESAFASLQSSFGFGGSAPRRSS